MPYQYRVVELNGNLNDGAILEEWGKQGWRLVNVTQVYVVGQYRTFAYFEWHYG